MRKRDTELGKKHLESAAKLSALAKFYRKHAGKESLPEITDYRITRLTTDYCFGKDDAKAKAKQLVKEFGKVDKIFSDSSLYLNYRDPDSGIEIEYTIARADVCKQVDTGEREKKMVKKLVKEAIYEEVEEEVPVLSWDCGSLLKESDLED